MRRNQLDIIKTLTTALRDADSQKERSVQVELGASSVGGCRAQAWHILNQTPTTNHDTESLAAIMGTALHSAIYDALKAHDIFGDDFILEEGFSDEYFKGHCDFYSRKAEAVFDFKTVTLAKMAKGTLPTKQQKLQVNIYGSLISQQYPVKTVGLVFIPRDGRFSDIRVWQADYDPKLVEEARTWVSEIKAMTSPPPPENSAKFFCKPYCKFYDPTGEIGCVGK
jgi:Domain of unknown function DUF83